MADDTIEDRLTILERAQLLHDATVRRHGDLLDDHAERLDQHAAQMALLRDLLERQTKTQQDLAATQAQLAETLDAIKDMLGRGNGH
jgi:uncharacterized phage infection (PIP) family protein YhgE